MPFYATDNMTYYMFVAITEHNESLDKDERLADRKKIEEIVNNRNEKELKELCEEFLSSQFINTDTPLFAAILNSIYLETLGGYLMDWIADCDVDDKADAEEELEAKMAEMKRLIDEKKDAYANLAKIAAEMDALADSKVISRPYNDCSCKSSCACND